MSKNYFVIFNCSQNVYTTTFSGRLWPHETKMVSFCKTCVYADVLQLYFSLICL